MESRETYGRSAVAARISDIQKLEAYAEAAGIPPLTALDNVLSLGLKMRRQELRDIRFREWEEAGQDEAENHD